MTYENYPPRPTAPSTQSNCLKAAGITCLVVLIIGIAVGIWIVTSLTKNPVIRNAYSGAKLMAECQLHLVNPQSPQDIHDALGRYVGRNGVYPDKLEDLYPNYIEDRGVLHCPADPRNKNEVSYQYFKPSVNAPDNTVIVECRRHSVIEDQPPWVLMLRKDGQVVQQGYQPSGPEQNPQ